MSAAGFPRGGSAIVGGATFGIGAAPGYTSMELAAKAGLNALADARLTLADVDGLFVCLPDDMLSGLSFAEYLGLHPRITENNRTGGSAFMAHVASAALALHAGLIDVALIAYGAVPRSSRSFVAPPGASVYETPYRVTLAASYALATPAPHARIRDDRRAARRGRGVGAAMGDAQSAGHHARPADDRRLPRLAHGRDAAAGLGLLPGHRWRRRDRDGPRRPCARSLRAAGLCTWGGRRQRRIGTSRRCPT